MPVACSTVFRQRLCHLPACAAVFYLCRHCDRGQSYCSFRCREKALRLQRRQANRRHQQSPEGRQDHRDRQRDYRQRQRERVTDKSSLPDSPRVSLSLRRHPEPRAALVPEGGSSPPAKLPAGWVVCQICGRQGPWLNSFAEGQHDFR